MKRINLMLERCLVYSFVLYVIRKAVRLDVMTTFYLFGSFEILLFVCSKRMCDI